MARHVISGSVIDEEAPLEVAESWHPELQSDQTANDSDKTFTVPAGVEWQPRAIYVNFTTTADVGNRQLSVVITNAAGVPVAESLAGVTQAASLVYVYTWGVGMQDLTAVRYSIHVATPLPAVVLPAGWKIRVYDVTATQAAADDMLVSMLVMSRSV